MSASEQIEHQPTQSSNLDTSEANHLGSDEADLSNYLPDAGYSDEADSPSGSEYSKGSDSLEKVVLSGNSNGQQPPSQNSDLLAEIHKLRQEVSLLKQENQDLSISLQTAIEHGDSVQAELQTTNQTLQTEVEERQQTLAKLQATLESEAALRQQTQELVQRIEQQTVELRQAEEKFRGIFEHSADGIFQTSPNGRFINVNPAMAKIYGYDSPEDLINSVTDVGTQLYVQNRHRDVLNVILRQQGAIENFQSEVYRKDGTIINISENVHEVRDKDGNLLYYEGSVRDITDLTRANAEIRAQRRRAEQLLLNVLPQPIAQRLRRGERTIADSFRSVTVLFADIVNFTELSTQVNAAELVEMLNEIFSRFDDLVDHYKVEKIKTIGDAYMVAGGLPLPRPDHVEAIANLALDMQKAVQNIQTPIPRPIAIRIGIHTGPVVAGVIGTRKFIYDLWGDTVNIASRMESQGESCKIQVSYPVYLQLHSRFKFHQRGLIPIKGSGQMMTYWLAGKREEG